MQTTVVLPFHATFWLIAGLVGSVVTVAHLAALVASGRRAPALLELARRMPASLARRRTEGLARAPYVLALPGVAASALSVGLALVASARAVDTPRALAVWAIAFSFVLLVISAVVEAGAAGWTARLVRDAGGMPLP